MPSGAKNAITVPYAKISTPNVLLSKTAIIIDVLYGKWH